MSNPSKARRTGKLMSDEKQSSEPGKETALPAVDAPWPAADHTKSPDAVAPRDT